MGQKSVHALLDNSLHSLLAFGFEEFLFVDVGVSMAYVVDHLLYDWKKLGQSDFLWIFCHLGLFFWRSSFLFDCFCFALGV